MPSRSLPRLYLVTDRQQTSQRPLISALTEALESGVKMVQIREKDLDTRECIELTRAIVPLVNSHNGITLLNDRVDLALALNMDGVHLRSDSLPLPQARRVLGTEKLIGLSTHSVDDVRFAQEHGADFVVLGPIFETPSKKEYGPPLGLQVLEHACQTSDLPVFAIGGVTATQIPSLLSAGAYGVAVISSILRASSIPDNTRQLLSQLF